MAAIHVRPFKSSRMVYTLPKASADELIISTSFKSGVMRTILPLGKAIHIL